METEEESNQQMKINYVSLPWYLCMSIQNSNNVAPGITMYIYIETHTGIRYNEIEHIDCEYSVMSGQKGY